MATAFIGEIRVVGFNFAPVGWLPCNGQLVSIQDYETLFFLIGTTYGGDGQTNFGLPDFRGRSPVHVGTLKQQTYALGALGGSETVTLIEAQIPTHVHPIGATNAAGQSASPAGQTFATSSLGQYETSGPQTSAAVLAPNPGGQPHPNLMPFQTLSYVIATEGIFPSRN